MLDETVERFTERLRQTVVQDQKMTSIPLAYLMRLDIPDSIKHFFDQEVEIWIREEEDKFTTNERFDYDTPEVRMLIDQIFDRLKQNATFHITKFNQLLERAVKLEMNYLIEPHRTLSQFLFKDSHKISTMEVYDTLKYFFRYEYYKNAISDYFNQKYLREIAQDQFDLLMDQIDEKAFGDNRIEAILGTVKTIMEFLSEAEGSEVSTLPVDVLYAALRDRKLTEYAQLADRLRSETKFDELTFEQIETLLRDKTLPGTEVAPGEEPSEKVGFENVADIESRQLEVPVADFEVPESQLSFDEEEETEEIEEEVEEEEEYEEEPEIAVEEKEAPAEFSYEEEREELPQEETAEAEPEPVEPSFEAESEEHKSSVADDLADHVARQIASDNPLQDLNPMISGRIRKKIIKKLFKKKEQDFLNFIATLNALSSWKEASRIIDDEFYTRGINPYSKEAISLSDIIYLRFFPKDKYVATEDDFQKF